MYGKTPQYIRGSGLLRLVRPIRYTVTRLGVAEVYSCFAVLPFCAAYDVSRYEMRIKTPPIRTRCNFSWSFNNYKNTLHAPQNNCGNTKLSGSGREQVSRHRYAQILRDFSNWVTSLLSGFPTCFQIQIRGMKLNFMVKMVLQLERKIDCIQFLKSILFEYTLRVRFKWVFLMILFSTMRSKIAFSILPTM